MKIFNAFTGILTTLAIASSLYSSESASIQVTLEIKEVSLMAVNGTTDLSEFTLGSVKEAGEGSITQGIGGFNLAVSTNVSNKIVTIKHSGDIPAGTLGFYLTDGNAPTGTTSPFAGSGNRGLLTEFPQNIIEGISTTAFTEHVTLTFDADMSDGAFPSTGITVGVQLVDG